MRGRLIDDLVRLCDDAGISCRELARSSGVPFSFLSRILAGKAQPSLETYARLAYPLGADLSSRLYPNTGPRIRDRHQGRVLECLLVAAHPRWRPSAEVTVHQPARGSIDLVLHEPRERLLVAGEIESELRRLEQQIRWGQEKAESLPSSRVWPHDDEPPRISRLLVVRRTRATRRVASEFARQLAVGFPAHPDDAVAALTGTTPWPGAALVWVAIERDRVRFVAGR